MNISSRNIYLYNAYIYTYILINLFTYTWLSYVKKYVENSHLNETALLQILVIFENIADDIYMC